MSAHRYWRIHITAIQGGNYNYDCIGRLDFYEGGTLLTNNGGAIAASSQYAYYSPDRIFNGGVGTWISNNETPCWVSYDFGAGVTHDVDSITFTADHSGNYPQTMLLEWSDDNATWTQQSDIEAPGAGWTNGQSYTFDTSPPAPPPPGLHRFWRLLINSGNDGSNISANNIQFHATVGGPNICTGGNGTSSSQYSSWNVNLAFSNTGQFATAGGAPQWVQYDLGTGVYNTVAEVLWQARTDGYNSQTPNDVQMQYSDDGATWTNFGLDYAFGSWSVGETKTFAITQPLPQSISKLAEYVVEGPVPVPQSISKLGEYVVEGPPPIPQAISKMGQYVVEGSTATQYVSKMAAYVVEGPPSESRTLSQAMLGTF